jgi:predicted nucleic acid-binding Zn ribbon protein
MLAGFPYIQCYGRQQCHSLSDQTDSDRYATHPETEGHCFVCSDALSGEIHSASCELKDIYETQRDERYIILYVFFLLHFLGEAWLPLAFMNTHP